MRRWCLASPDDSDDDNDDDSDDKNDDYDNDDDPHPHAELIEDGDLAIPHHHLVPEVNILQKIGN